MKTPFYSCFAKDLELFIRKSRMRGSGIVLQSMRFTSLISSVRIAVYQTR